MYPKKRGILKRTDSCRLERMKGMCSRHFILYLLIVETGFSYKSYTIISSYPI